VIRLNESNDDPQFVAFYGVADKAIDLLRDTLREVGLVPQTGRRNIYLQRWTMYLGTLAHELALASAQLLLLEMPRAAIVTIRSVFEYSVRNQWLFAHGDKAEAFMDSLQWRVLKEAEFTPDYFKEVRDQFAENYEKWADENPELETETLEGSFTGMAREVLGSRFGYEFFRHYSYPSIITHGKPHGIQDVLGPVTAQPNLHSWDSLTIDPLSELSKLASTVIEYMFFIRRKYGLDVSKVVEVNELHGAVQRQFGYIL